MRVEGQIGLERIEGLEAGQRALLEGLWLESVEEVVAALAAFESDLAPAEEQDGRAALVEVGRLGLAVLPREAVERVSRPCSARALGCRVTSEQLGRFARAGCVELPEGKGKGPEGIERGLPASVRLLDRLGSARDQGDRGTCVAFAGAALREFLLGGEPLLSEQFLYWACKELDGSPKPGTYLHTAMSALNRYGICRAETWPYNPDPTGDDEGQGPPPVGAGREGLEYRLMNTRPVEPGLVMDYKHMLAGDSQTPGMPVVFGTLVFRSWLRSAESQRTGKVTLPLPGEMPLGGHAWCAVGYVDDRTVPGGGYFIVRNSWGANWAPASPERPGYALMPYAYVERCALEAFTGPAEGGEPRSRRRRRIPAAVDHGDFTPFIRTLEADTRDMDQALQPGGTRVLADPLEPRLVRRDTPLNRRAFLLRDCTWSDETRRRLWFPVFGGDRDFGHAAAELEEVIRKAQAALDANLRGAVGKPRPFLPHPRLRAWLLPLLPVDWAPRITGCEAVADLSSELVALVKSEAGVPAELAWPDDWNDRVGQWAFLRVYELRGAGRPLHVVATCFRRLRLDRAEELDSPPRACFQGVDPACLDRVAALYDEWWRGRAGGGPEPAQVAFSITLAEPLPPTLAWQAEGRRWTVVCRRRPASPHHALDAPGPICERPVEENRFRPPHSTERDFLDRLKPESEEEQSLRVREWVEYILELEGGQATVAKVRDRTGYRASVVERAFLALQEGGDYRIRRVGSGGGRRTEALALGRAKAGEGIELTARCLSRPYLQRHALRIGAIVLGVAVSRLAGWVEHQFAGGGWIGLVGDVGLVLILYLGNRLQNQINRRADRATD